MGWLLLTRYGTGEEVQMQTGGWYTVVNPRVSGVKGWSSSGRRHSREVHTLSRAGEGVGGGLVPKFLPQSTHPLLGLKTTRCSGVFLLHRLRSAWQGLKHEVLWWGAVGTGRPHLREAAPWEWFFQHLVCWCWTRSLALHRGLQSQHTLRLKGGVGGRGG